MTPRGEIETVQPVFEFLGKASLDGWGPLGQETLPGLPDTEMEDGEKEKMEADL